VPLVKALESGQLSGHYGFPIRLSGKRLVANDHFGPRPDDPSRDDENHQPHTTRGLVGRHR